MFKDANPAIIDRAAFEKIQAKRGKMRKRNTSDGEKNMFSGLLVCADCGSNMNYHFNQINQHFKKNAKNRYYLKRKSHFQYTHANDKDVGV